MDADGNLIGANTIDFESREARPVNEDSATKVPFKTTLEK